MWKRKKRAPEPEASQDRLCWPTGNEMSTRNFCDICGERALASARRCPSHRGVVFGNRDVVRGEYETRSPQPGRRGD